MNDNQTCSTNPIDCAKACLSAVFGCRVGAFFASIAVAAGVVVGIAGGFYLTYLAITLIGN